MKKRSKILKTKIKKLIALQFVEKSIDLLSQSEFASLMEEISILTNIKILKDNNLIHTVYEKSSKIESELKELLVKVSLMNKIDTLALDLEKKATILKISSVLVFVSTIGFLAYEEFCPYIQILSLMEYITVGLMITLILSIIDSLKIYYESDKIFRKIYG